MQKVYLLLRSNRQSGPYSLEELLQLNLKPFDLVWVEGRSAAWQYPSEIPSLKPYVAETPQAEVPFQPVSTAAMEDKFSSAANPVIQKTEVPRRVFVSVPKTYTPANQEPSYEKEEVKAEIPSYSQAASFNTQQQPVKEDVLRSNYSRSLNDVEENYTNWVYQKKTKKRSSVNPKDLVLAALILAVIGGGYYVMSRPSVANSVLPANKTITQAIQQPVDNKTEEKEIPAQAQKSASAIDSPKPEPTRNNKLKNPVSVSRSQTAETIPSAQDPIPIEKTSTNITDNNGRANSNEPEVKQPKVEKAPEKKKTLGDVIKGIFSRKEKKGEAKNDPVVLEDPKRATNRQATKRESNENPSPGEDSKEVNTAALMDHIDLSSNAPDNWMMGVRNLKVTLRNGSTVTIQTASVAVNYYDENNQLLEKKLIYFSNVAPKAKATVAAPDHKWADHVDFKLVTATAKEDRYASH
jgi:hypothetical protein